MFFMFSVYRIFEGVPLYTKPNMMALNGGAADGNPFA